MLGRVCILRTGGWGGLAGGYAAAQHITTSTIVATQPRPHGCFSLVQHFVAQTPSLPWAILTPKVVLGTCFQTYRPRSQIIIAAGRRATPRIRKSSMERASQVLGRWIVSLAWFLRSGLFSEMVMVGSRSSPSQQRGYTCLESA